MLFYDYLWYELLPKVFNMSVTASIMIIAVLIVRIVLRKSPKIFSYVLWGAVLFRLLCPVSLSSQWSILNVFSAPVTRSGSIEYVPEDIVHMENPAVDIPVPGVNALINEQLPQGREQLAADPLEFPMTLATYIWIAGMLTLLVYSVVQYIRLRRKLIGTVCLGERIYLSDYIDVPFVMGLFSPKIYIPSSLTEKEQTYVILHEQHHIHRGDHVIKMLAFAALCVHWFNPLVWLAFALSGKDMEMSCDEAVMRKMRTDIRAEYSMSLLRLATGRRAFVGTPLAFGEGDTKARIENVMNYKKPRFWGVVAAMAVCTIVCVSLLTNPVSNGFQAPEPFGHSYQVKEMIYDAPNYRNATVLGLAPQYGLSSDYVLVSIRYVGSEEAGKVEQDVRMCGSADEVRLTSDNFDRYFDNNLEDGQTNGGYPEEIRRRNRSAWQVIDEENKEFYYILRQKDGTVYLAYGDLAEDESQSHIRQMYALEVLPELSCDAVSEGLHAYVEGTYYPDGFDYDYEKLAVGAVNDEGTLTFNVGWDTDTLVVEEDYYAYPNANEGIVQRKVHALKKNSQGQFVLEVSRRNNVRDEEAVYFIRGEDGVYVLKIEFPLKK